MSIGVLKLITGEEIIGDIQRTLNAKGEAVFEIKHPVQMAMVGRDQMAFIKYMPYADTETTGFYLLEKFVMFELPLAKELQQEYQAATSMVVTPPPKKLILGGS